MLNNHCTMNKVSSRSRQWRINHC